MSVLQRVVQILVTVVGVVVFASGVAVSSAGEVGQLGVAAGCGAMSFNPCADIHTDTVDDLRPAPDLVAVGLEDPGMTPGLWGQVLAGGWAGVAADGCECVYVPEGTVFDDGGDDQFVVRRS